MDWNNPQAGYVLAAYAITALSLVALIAWILLRDRAAASDVKKLKA